MQVSKFCVYFSILDFISLSVFIQIEKMEVRRQCLLEKANFYCKEK